MKDFIKRADAIKAVSEPFDRKYWQYTTRSIRDTVKALKDIPSAEPTIEIDADQLAKLLREGWTIHSEPKQGEWIDMGDFEQCSVCKGTHLKEFQSYYGKTTWIKTPYCPNCGARMKGADNDSR